MSQTALIPFRVLPEQAHPSPAIWPPAACCVALTPHSPSCFPLLLSIPKDDLSLSPTERTEPGFAVRQALIHCLMAPRKELCPLYFPSDEWHRGQDLHPAGTGGCTCCLQAAALFVCVLCPARVLSLRKGHPEPTLHWLLFLQPHPSTFLDNHKCEPGHRQPAYWGCAERIWEDCRS